MRRRWAEPCCFSRASPVYWLSTRPSLTPHRLGIAAISRYGMDEPLEISRKRLLFRSWHRGTREADLLLGSFAERHLGEFTRAQLDRYALLLECPDADLWDWMAGRIVPPPGQDSDVLRMLMNFRYTPRSA